MPNLWSDSESGAKWIATDDDIAKVRFGQKGEAYALLHQLCSGRLPEPAVFDAAIDTLKDANPWQLNKLRQTAARSSIEHSIVQVRQGMESACQNAMPGVERACILDQESFAAFCQQGGEVFADCIFENESVFVSAALLNQDNLSQFIEQLTWHSRIIFWRIETLKNFKKWNQQMAVRYVARIAAHIIEQHLTAGPTRQYSVGKLAYLCNQSAARILEHFRVGSTFVAQGVDAQHQLQQRSEPLHIVQESTDQTEKDREHIDTIESLSESERVRRVLAHVRQSTDDIRTQLIPKLILSGATSEQAFWAIHKAHFEQEPYVAHMHGGSHGGVPEYAKNSGGRDFYQKNVGKTRFNYVTSSWTGHLDVSYLRALEDRFFAALTAAEQRVTCEDEALDLITVADMFHITAHLPFDGAGRTYEDFAVYLGQKLGYPLTVSASGYRHLSSSAVKHRVRADDAYKRERDEISLRKLGVQFDPQASTENWLQHMQVQLANRFSENGQKIFASEQALEAQRIIQSLDCIAGGQSYAQKYTSYAALRGVWAQARQGRYVVAATEGSAAACDRTLADIESEGVPSARLAVLELEHAHPDDPLVASIAGRYLRPTLPEDVLRVARRCKIDSEPAEAIALYEQLIQQQPEHCNGMNELALLLVKTDRSAEAEALWRKIIAIDGDNTYARNNLGEYLMQRTEGIPEAQAHLEHALHVSPQYALPRMNLARLHRAIGEVRVANDYYSHCIENFRPTLDDCFEYITFLTETGFDAARLYSQVDYFLTRIGNLFADTTAEPVQKELIEYIKKLLIMQPQNTRAHSFAAWMFEVYGQLDLAERHLHVVLKNNPADIDRLVQLARILSRIPDRRDECHAALRQYAEQAQPSYGYEFRVIADAVGFEYERPDKRNRIIIDPE